MSDRLRPRLSRTLAPGRWREYRRLLRGALDGGYRIVALDRWVREDAPAAGPQLVLRHDVDQHPRSALAMAAIERELGVEATWYFRWRTADPGVVAALRETGATVGLHYETLSRIALERGLRDPEAIAAAIPEARAVLRAEVVAFERAHGPIRSICAHGDTRAPAVRNTDLTRGVDPAAFGVDFDANDAMRGRDLARWLTDRAGVRGGWSEDCEPDELFAARVSPVLCVVHPNNWVSGPSLWLDRALARALPAAPASDRPRGPLRTGVDVPPL